MQPVALDEYPIHQAPLSMRFVPSSDRNFYDRCYFNAHDRTGEIFLITGGGVYPNLGVVDAYACVRRGNQQWSVRCSDALDDRPLDLAVGPYRVEVIEPLKRIRLICEADEHGLGFDLTFDGSHPATMEQPHLMRSGPNAIIDTSRFAQLGSWEGTLRVDGDEYQVNPDTWLGSRDRSWGIRPVGDGTTTGRAASDFLNGIWWLYVPLRFEDFTLVVICQENPDGFRVLNDASRVWADGSIEQLGWPDVTIDYRPGTRIPERAHIGLTERGGKRLQLTVESLGYVVLHMGAGYTPDSGWTHGSWRGRNWIEGAVYDLTDPTLAPMIPFGVLDHVGKATLDGDVGWGLFEHGTIGRHDPSGFADFEAVAP